METKDVVDVIQGIELRRSLDHSQARPRIGEAMADFADEIGSRYLKIKVLCLPMHVTIQEDQS